MLPPSPAPIATSAWRRASVGSAITAAPMWPLLLVLAALLPIALFFAGMAVGARQERALVDRAQAKQVQAQFERYAEAAQVQERRAELLAADLRQLSLFHARLQQRIAHAPLALVATAARPGAADAAPPTPQLATPAHAAAAVADVAAPAAPGPAAAEPGGDGVRVRLTFAAVGLWNSALRGVDMAAGPCGADGTPAGACAAGSGAWLEDAWANHAENAERCAADRKRLVAFQDLERRRLAAERELKGSR